MAQTKAELPTGARLADYLTVGFFGDELPAGQGATSLGRSVLKEIASERAVTSRGKRNPRGVKRKLSKFDLRKRGDPSIVSTPLHLLLRPA